MTKSKLLNLKVGNKNYTTMKKEEMNNKIHKKE